MRLSRRAFLALAGVGMASGAAHGAPVKEPGHVWGEPFHDPETLRPAMVDELMWPIVERINRSRWIWTAESCQGYPDGGRGPMLGLVAGDPGTLHYALSRVITEQSTQKLDPDLELRYGLYVESRLPRLGAYQVRLSFDATTYVSRTRQLRIFEALAREVTR